MDSLYVMALSAGFLGGTHCLGMCGPIVAAYGLPGEGAAAGSTLSMKRMLPHILYNTGRLTTYSFIGALMGFAGSGINGMSGFQNLVAFIAGAVMIIMGLSIAGQWNGVRRFEKKNRFILQMGQLISGERSVWKYFILGSLFGFLPCGLSYTAFIAAAGTGSLLSGLLLTLLFGLGTIPWMVLFGLAIVYLSASVRGIVYRLSGIAVIVMGVMFLMKGIRFYA